MTTAKYAARGAIIAALVFVSSRCGMFSRSATARVTAGKEFASIVNLPGGSNPSAAAVEKGHLRNHDWDDEVYFRNSPGSDEILLRMLDKTTDGGYYFGDA